MEKSISKNISSITYVFILAIMLILVVYQKYQNNDVKYKLKIINDRSQALMKDITIQSNLEGKNLWDVFSVSKEEINKIVQENNIRANYILFYVDSISCLSCFNFHIDNLIKLSDIKIIIYSPTHLEYVKSYIKNGILYKSLNNFDNYKTIKNNMIILLVNINGQIIYSDVADKLNYDKSRKFYRKIKQYIKTTTIK